MNTARILVIKQQGLQPFVEAEPSFAAIRAAYPGVGIDLLTSPELGRLAKGAPYFDRVLAAGPLDTRVQVKEFAGQLKRAGYEAIFDLDGTRTSLDIRGAVTGLRGPRWVGPRRVMSRGTQVRYGGTAMRRTLSDAGLDVGTRLPDLRWALSGRKDAANMQPSWFGISGAYALFILADDPTHRWPAAHYGAVAQALTEEGLLSVIIGDDSVSDFAREISHAASKKGKAAASGTVVDLTGKADLAQIAMLARNAAFFVAGASDELHLCVSVGCPGVVLLHPADVVSSESLFGRQVIKITATDMGKLSPDTALAMLRNMSLIGRRGPNLPRAQR